MNIPGINPVNLNNNYDEKWQANYAGFACIVARANIEKSRRGVCVQLINGSLNYFRIIMLCGSPQINIKDHAYIADQQAPFRIDNYLAVIKFQQAVFLHFSKFLELRDEVIAKIDGKLLFNGRYI